MASSIYNKELIILVDGNEIEIAPLKIKYMREFMRLFDNIKKAENDYEAIERISDCVRVAMKQYYPSIKTIEDVEDNLDLSTMYKILDVAANIKANNHKDTQDVVIQQSSSEGSSWEDLDLAKLEAEIFLTGIWKNYEELESSISVPELFATLEAKRELDYSEKKFMAAMQGVDLDEQTGKNKESENAWEKLKAKVASGGATDNANDILGYQGVRAAQAGFGIGMGIDYATEL